MRQLADEDDLQVFEYKIWLEEISAITYIFLNQTFNGIFVNITYISKINFLSNSWN